MGLQEIPRGINLPQTPVSVNTSMSVTTPCRTTPPPLESFHPPSLRRTPPEWLETGTSPVSNLALRPEYQLGPDDSMTSEIEEAQQSFAGTLDAEESVFSAAYANDIQAQHSNLMDHPEGPSSNQASCSPQQWDGENAADSDVENKTRLGQTTPGDHGTIESDDEL
jgi:hypothetical protein